MEEKGLLYGLGDRPKLSVTVVSALQWLVFIMLNNIFIPIVVASLYGLNPTETAQLVQRTIFVVGAASLLQLYWGHRLPIVEGVAGLWWSIFILMAGSASALGLEPREMLPGLEGGLVVSGLLLVVLSMSPLFHKIEGLFTPLVTGTYLILLALQMSTSFMGSLLGVREGEMDFRILIVSVVTISVTLVLSYKGKGMLKSFSALGGVMTGWITYQLMNIQGEVHHTVDSAALISVPRPFAWGWPVWDAGIILTAVITSIMLLSNLFASIQVLSFLQPGEVSKETTRRGGIFNGVGDMLAGIFSTVGTTPFSIVVGFIKITGNAARAPFAAASFLMLVSGLLNPVGRFFTSLPAVLGYAVSFLTFAQMAGFGIRNIVKSAMEDRDMLITALGVCVGAGIMFVPPQIFQTIPGVVRSIISNGMLVGTLLVLVLEHGVMRKSKD